MDSRFYYERKRPHEYSLVQALLKAWARGPEYHPRPATLFPIRVRKEDSNAK